MNAAIAARLYKCQTCGRTLRVEESDLRNIMVVTTVFVCGQNIERHSVACPCGNLMGTGTGNTIIGKLSTTKHCDSRCTMATGKSCTCDCAGRNHGADYRIAA